MIRLKFCGMRTPEEVALCARAGADALGFIFAPGPRQVGLDDAARLTAVAPAHVKRVGVFANAPRDLIEAALERCALDVLQFAGNELPEFCGAFGVPTMLTAREHAPPPDVMQRARAIAIIADARSNGAYGGTGVRVERAIVQRIRDGATAQFILAGGLTPDNVADAIRTVRPDGVDVRSGVERDGYKDPQLVAAFADAAIRALSANENGTARSLDAPDKRKS